MTTITVKLTKPETTVYFDPPLQRRDKVQIITHHHDSSDQIAVLCDIVEPTSSFANFVQKKFGPSRLLGIVPSRKYPRVDIQNTKSQDSISSMKFSLLDKNGGGLKIKDGETYCICLRIYD